MGWCPLRTTVTSFLVVPAALGLLQASASPPTANDKAGAPAKEAILLVGPFTLAEACDKGSRFVSEYASEGGPAPAEMRKALDACKLSLVDQKTRGPKGWRFAPDDKYPKVVAEGPLRFELKDKQGRDFTVQLVRAYFVPQTTDNSKAPPTRSGYIQAALRVEGTWGIFHRTSTYYTAPAISYDMTGATDGLKKKTRD